MAATDQLIQFYAKLNTSNARVDKDGGVIRGVSVITGNLTAIGHDLDVDDTTLEQVELQGRERKKVPVKVNHGSGVDAVCGHLINFRREGNKVLADWKLLKSHPNFDTILETAEEQPETVGLSVSFKGPDTPVIEGGKSKARCEKLLSTDYVIHPAANPTGLFQQKHPVDNQNKSKMAEENKEPTLSDVMDALNGLKETVAANSEFIQSQQAAEAEAEALQIAGLTEEQAEELGVEAEDLQAAQQFITEQYGEDALAQVHQEMQAEINGEDGDWGEAGENQNPGEGQNYAPDTGGESGAAAAEGAAPAASSAGFASLQKAVTDLTARLDKKEFETERAKLDEETQIIETRFAELEEKEKKLTELETENQELKRALGGAGRRPVTTNFSAAGLPVNEDDNAFESRVAAKAKELSAQDPELAELAKTNKKLAEIRAANKAWEFCIKQDPKGYEEFRAKGGNTTTL